MMRKRYDTTEASFWGCQVVKQGLKKFEHQIINKYLTQPGKVLDLGCGGGREAIVLARQGHQVVGLDLSATMVKLARQNALRQNIKNIYFQQGNACALPFNEQEFDYVIALEKLINHIPSRHLRLKALKEIRRVLKPRGYLITVSNSINGRWFYPIYFKIINAWRKLYNPQQFEPNSIIPRHTRGKFKPFQSGPSFHWYSALEFIDDLCVARLKLVDFLSAKEIESDQRNFNFRENSGQICYVAQKFR